MASQSVASTKPSANVLRPRESGGRKVATISKAQGSEEAEERQGQLRRRVHDTLTDELVDRTRMLKRHNLAIQKMLRDETPVPPTSHLALVARSSMPLT